MSSNLIVFKDKYAVDFNMRVDCIIVVRIAAYIFMLKILLNRKDQYDTDRFIINYQQGV